MYFRQLFRAQFLIFAALIIIISILIIPVFNLLIVSVVSDGRLSGDNFIFAFGQMRHIQGFFNSIKLALASVFLSFLFAVPIALAVSRTNIPLKKLQMGAILAAFIIPNYLGAIAWILLAGPQAGYLNKIWMHLTGAETGIFNIYSFWGIAFVVSLSHYPLVFIFAKSSFDLISSELEEAATIYGATKFQILSRVILPLGAPAILGSGILVFLETIALFGTPILLGIPARINLVAIQISYFFEYPINVAAAAAYAIPVVLLTVVLLKVQSMLVKKDRYVTTSGKTNVRYDTLLSKALKYILLGYSSIIIALSFVLPMLSLLYASFLKSWGAGFSIGNITLGNYISIITRSAPRSALINTLVYSVIAAIICVLLGGIIAYFAKRRILPLSRIMLVVASLPIAIPGIVLGVALYAFHSKPPLTLYGTATLIIIGFVTRFLPVAIIGCTTVIESMNKELEEAARIAGAKFKDVILKILFPISKRALIGVFILVLTFCTKELSTAIFLTGPRTKVLSVFMLDLSEQGQYEMLSAIGVTLTAFILFLIGLVYIIAGKDFMMRNRS